MQTWNTWSKRGHMQTWNILSTPERVVPRNGHGLFKGISYGLLIRNIATTVSKAQVHCIGIEPVIALAGMPAPSSASRSEAQPGTTPKAPPPSVCHWIPRSVRWIRSCMDQKRQTMEQKHRHFYFPNRPEWEDSDNPGQYQKLEQQHRNPL